MADKNQQTQPGDNKPADEAPKSVRSMDALAAIMAENREKMQQQAADKNKKPAGQTPPKAQARPNGKDEEDEDEDDLDDDQTQLGDEEDADGDDGDDDNDEGGDGEEGEDGDDDDGFEIDDETEFEFEDGTTATLSDLKKVYQADATVVETVKATEATYLEANQIRTKAIEDGNKMSAAMKALIPFLDQIVAQPLVKDPDPALKTTDAARYWAQYEAKQNDNQRIAQGRQALLTTMQQFNKQMEDMKENTRAQEMNVLVQKLPVLKDNKTKEAASRDILDAAKFYGFTDAEVASGVDHRVYMMAYDAQQYRKLKAGTKEEKETKKTKITSNLGKGPKVLRSGGTSARGRLTTAQKRVKVVKSKAQETGRAQDVAEFMTQSRDARSR